MIRAALLVLALCAASSHAFRASPLRTLNAAKTGIQLRPSLAGSFNLKMNAEAAAPSDPPAPVPEQKKFLGVERKVIKKLLPLGMMFFCILFNYTILRDTKDVLVVTAPKSGAEIIPFLKTYVNLPAAIGFTVFYSRLCNALPQAQVFYSILIPFLTFFGAFGGFIYPFRNYLHPHAAADFLAHNLPTFFLPLIAIFRNWTYAVFYVMAELWGSVVVSVLFWGFANEIATVQEAKKYYPLFGFMANIALIFSGQYVKLVSDIRSRLPSHVDAWGYSLRLLMGAVVTFGTFIMGLYSHMQRNVLTDPECVNPNREQKRKKTKTSMSVGESAQFLAKSKYIRSYPPCLWYRH